MPDASPERISDRADFSGIRYAQCWEDADVLLAALEIQPGDRCLAIASAGDNALAMLTCAPQQVMALDLSPAQLACLALRVAAYRELSHPELLVLMGSHPETAQHNRTALYQRCRSQLSGDDRHFWDTHPAAIEAGIGHAGKFERYFTLFRQRVLPWVHGRSQVQLLLAGGPLAERQQFYDRCWNSWRWRLMFRLFFSRWVMGRAGRDPSFFQYVEGSVADRIYSRTEHALTQLNPAENPYLHWILTGHHGDVLPYALRPQHFDTIRNHLNRLEWRCCSLEDYLAQQPDGAIARFNLSDIFEYLSPPSYHHLLRELIRVGQPGGRLVYWNMLAGRSRPDTLAAHLQPLTALAQQLHHQDKAFFYSALVIEALISSAETARNFPY